LCYVETFERQERPKAKSHLGVFVAMSNATIEGFSLSHVAILDGETGAEEVDGDIYGVRSATLAADTGNYDNTGDDKTLSSWYWFNFGTLTVEAGYVPWKLIRLLSGAAIEYSDDVTSPTPTWSNALPLDSDTTARALTTDGYRMSLWNESSLNQPAKPVLIMVPAKDRFGTPRSFSLVLYRVQFSPFNFTGPSYKSGLLLNYTGRAVMSEYDEKQQPLADPAIGRMLNMPA
jgi:hypothetical protein